MLFNDTHSPEEVRRLVTRAMDTTPERVERALSATNASFSDFLALISPAAADFLEQLAARAQRITRERFGRIVRLYAPIYVSNECTNSCAYCGFNKGNEVRRITLTPEEVFEEARALWHEGFRDILLVSGEAPNKAPLSQLVEAARMLSRDFPSISVEIYPLETEGYVSLERAGVEGVTVFQETYDPELYAKYHLGGKKRDFDFRLATPDRIGAAGMRKIGLGALLGLGHWRFEAVSLAMHALYLQKTYWQTNVSISFPRIRAASGGFLPPSPVSDREMAQLAFALRLLIPDIGLTLSTRETAEFRDGITPICFTSTSAGSKTEPGGYTRPGEATEQFAIEDSRTPGEVAEAIRGMGLEPVWKDWDRAFIAAESMESLPKDAERMA
mgnify:CR=1 FL=1